MTEAAAEKEEACRSKNGWEWELNFFSLQNFLGKKSRPGDVLLEVRITMVLGSMGCYKPNINT